MRRARDPSLACGKEDTPLHSKKLKLTSELNAASKVSDKTTSVGQDQNQQEEEGHASVPTNMGPFQTLPTELLLYVLSFLEHNDFAVLSLLNSTWKDLSEDDEVWLHLCKQKKVVQAHYQLLKEICLMELGKLKWKQIYRHLARNCKCKVCHHTFRPMNNSERACLSHPGRWKPSLTVEGDKWTCCSRTRRDSEGCHQDWHQDAHTWMGLFWSLSHTHTVSSTQLYAVLHIL